MVVHVFEERDDGQYFVLGRKFVPPFECIGKSGEYVVLEDFDELAHRRRVQDKLGDFCHPVDSPAERVGGFDVVVLLLFRQVFPEVLYHVIVVLDAFSIQFC